MGGNAIPIFPPRRRHSLKIEVDPIDALTRYINMLQATASILSEADAPAVCAVRLYAPGPAARHPFHLVFLLDVSGSMDGERICAVKQTLHDVLDLLTPADRISLIPYSSSATVLRNACPVTPECVDSIRASVAELRAEGGTHLEAGLGCLRELAVPPDALVLLTDGHCNIGARHASQLLQIAHATLPATLPVHTIGYGADHNQRLLAELATTTHGSYGFAEHHTQIPLILGDIVGSLATRMAHRVCVDCHGGDGWAASHMEAGHLIADREHWVVFLATGATTAAPVLEVSWTPFAEPAEPARIVCAVGTEIDPVDIAEQRDRVHVAAELDLVVNDILRGATTRANDRLHALREFLGASRAVGRPLHTRLLAQVSEYLADIASDATDEDPTSLVSRMLSRNTTLTLQRGVSSADPAENMFSSPLQRRVARTLLDSFTQSIRVQEHDESF